MGNVAETRNITENMFSCVRNGLEAHVATTQGIEEGDGSYIHQDGDQCNTNIPFCGAKSPFNKSLTITFENFVTCC